MPPVSLPAPQESTWCSAPAHRARWWSLLPATFLVGLLLSPPALGQQVTARVAVDSVSVGERFLITVTARHSAAARVTFPDPAQGDPTFGDVTLLKPVSSGERIPDAAKPDARIDSMVYEAAAFAVDSALVAPIPVRIVAPESTFTLATQPLSIPVRSIVPDGAQEIRDLAPIVEFRRPWWHWALIVAGILLLVGLAGWLIYRRLHKRQAIPAAALAPARALSPYEHAEERLRELEAVDLTRPDAVKPFYIELSDLLRTYLTQRLGVRALELTTRELLDALARPAPNAPARAVDAARLRPILETADLVKFADAQPDPSEGRRLIAETRTALADTESALRPAPEPAESSSP